MGVRFPTQAVNGQTPALPANANETIITTLPPLTITLDGAQIAFWWFLSILAGTGTTALAIRMRLGATLTGAAFGFSPWTHTLAAGNSAVLSGVYFASPGAVAGQQAVLTVSQTGATAAGTVVDSALYAVAL